jgi:superfamily II RNA helicase
MASGRFDTLLSQVQGRLEVLDNQAKEFASKSLDMKRQMVGRSVRDFANIDNTLKEMERLIQTMPQRDHDFFKEDLAMCQDQIPELKRLYEGFTEEVEQLEREEQARIARGEALDANLVEDNRQKIGGVLGDLNFAIASGNDTLKTQEHTMGVLAEDRDALGRVNSNLDVIDNEAAVGLAAAGRMLKRAMLNGVVTWTINILLVAILIVVLVWKLGFL